MSESVTRGLGLGCMAMGAVAASLFATAPAVADTFVYVTNSSSPISQYEITDSGALSPLSSTAGRSATSVVAGPNGRSVYAGTWGAIDQYDVGADGRLSPKSPGSVAAPGFSVAMAISADGRYLFVSGTGGDAPTLSVYPVAADGALSPAPTWTGPSNSALGVAVSRDGVYLRTYSAVVPYGVRAGGALVPKRAVSAPALGRGLAVSHDGKSVYVPSSTTVLQYDVGAGGALAPKSPAAVDLGGEAGAWPAVSPDDTNVYVTNEGTDTVSQFRAGLDGSLSPLRPAAVGSGQDPTALALSPDGEYLYTANAEGGSVSMFHTRGGGLLSPMRPGVVPAGMDPSGIVVVDRATARRDTLDGTAAGGTHCGLGGGDIIRARGGDDTVFGDACAGGGGAGGRDRLFGGDGNDTLHGGPGADRLDGGNGRDLLRGGPGADVIDARDGSRDRVVCGRGRDTVRADGRDLTRGCERGPSAA